jgi:hypothetical protein
MNGKQAKALRKLALKVAEHKAEGGNLEYATYTDHQCVGSKQKPKVFTGEDGKMQIRMATPTRRVLDHTCTKGVYRRLKRIRRRGIGI